MSNFQQDRLAICGLCEYNEGGDCIICGCFLDNKTSIPEESCPLSPGAKWGPYIEPVLATPITQETPQVLTPVRSSPPPCEICTKRR